MQTHKLSDKSYLGKDKFRTVTSYRITKILSGTKYDAEYSKLINQNEPKY